MGTEKSAKEMFTVPFVFHVAKLFALSDAMPGADLPTTQDQLPSVVESDAAGYVLTGGTRLTAVLHETTDDN